MTVATESHLLPIAPGPSGQRGVYVHVPFCIVRCAYCDFNAYAGMDDLKVPYVEALLREIEAAADGGPVTTVFFGGGTPTELDASQLSSILQAVNDGFDVADDAEVTIEANPESVDLQKLAAVRAAGFNRISMGVQSTSYAVLSALGRVHDPAKALGALRAAVEAGFEHVNGDLIYGTPGESVDDWRRSIEEVLATGVDHVSAYALTVEEGTPLHGWVRAGTAAGPDEDDQADKYEVARSMLDAAGFERYEVSNWSKPGAWSRHNVIYWTASDHLGFGAGAHAHVGGRRSWNVKSPQAYVARTPDCEDGSEMLDPRARVAEAAILGLRLGGGIDRQAFAVRWGADPFDLWPEELAAAAARGLIEMTPSNIRVAPDSFFISGEVARSLI